MALNDHWEAQRAEILSLQSIYCSPGECSLLGLSFDELEVDEHVEKTDHVPHGQISLVVRLTVPGVTLEQEATVSVTFKLGASYPVESPLISLSSDRFAKGTLLDMERRVVAYSQTLAPEPCLYFVLEWLKDSITEMVTSNPSCLLQCPGTYKGMSDVAKKTSHSQGSLVSQSTNSAVKPAKSKTHSKHHAQQSICIVRIDHMRNEPKYFKTLRSWAGELETSGRVINAGRRAIYIILVGSNSKLSEFLRRWRTQSVDVDSQGKPCKEKLISILCQQCLDAPLPTWQRLVSTCTVSSQEKIIL